MPELNQKKLNAFIQKSRKPFEAALKNLVEIPTVSSDPAHRQDIESAAQLTAGIFAEFGARTEYVKTDGHPMVIGIMGEQSTNPTVLIYNHLDVQPADEDEWDQDPFVLTINKGRYGGRGTTDDKGPALTALFAAKYAREQGIPLNFRFLWEFEEEIGSPNFEKALRSQKQLLQADSILVSDTVWISKEKPAIPFGIRGLLTATLSLETASQEAHSGLVGGAARNPMGELFDLIARCYNPLTGEVKIPGFHDNVLEPAKEEIQGFLESGFKVTQFKRAHGLKSLRFKETGKVLEAIWSRPTFEVHGLVGGYRGEGVKTIVPSRAEVKVSMRLVPRQDPKRIFALLRDFVKEQNPDVKVKQEAVLEPYLASPTGEHLQAGVEAMTFGFQKRPALVREGGSIGAVVSLNRLLKAPVLFLGLSLPEHGYHAPNEYFQWTQVRGGIRTFVHYFERISQIESFP
jgi:acetylornithine deacetylase/succinyl-diaminopimelate desuccinylase-like protein